jgi:hypothetical protein
MDRVTAQSRALVVRVARHFIETHCILYGPERSGLPAFIVCFNKVIL